MKLELKLSSSFLPSHVLGSPRVFGWVGGEGTATTAEDQAIHFTELYPLKSTNILQIKQPYLFFYPYATRTLRESKKRKRKGKKEKNRKREGEIKEEEERHLHILK